MNAITQFPAQASGPRLDNRRVAAAVVDLAAVGVVGAVLGAAAGGEFTPLLGAVTVGWALFYYFVSESAGGQTLGKRLLGLRVERAGGGTPDEREIALRTILRVVDGIGLYLVGLVVMLRSGERRQRLGDIVAGTVIVDARGPSKPSVKSSLKAVDVSLAPEVPEAAAASEEKPHRAEVPSHLFNLESDEKTDSDAVEDDGPRVEIVSRGEEDLAADDAPPAELPVAEAEVEEPAADELEPAAELELPQPEPEPEPEPELPAADVEAESEAGEEKPSDADAALPRMSSPALEELADDVASSASKPRRRPRREAEPVASDEAEAEKTPSDEPLTVKPVETVSPMDLVMGETEDEPEKAGKGPRARARTRGGAG